MLHDNGLQRILRHRHEGVIVSDIVSSLHVQLLGPGELRRDGKLLHLHSAKVFALLAYLVIESDRAHSRTKLAALLWPDLPEVSARQSLRQAVYSLKSAGSGHLDRCLQADQELLRWSSVDTVDTDAVQFLESVGGLQEPLWTAAAALYRAPLLEGRCFAGCTAYEAWLASTRERLQALALQNLDRLAITCIARDDWDMALPYARKLIQIDSTSEVGVRHLFRILAATGQVNALDTEWRRLCSRLKQELDVEPTAETAGLYQALSGRNRGLSLPAAAPQEPCPGAALPSTAEVDAIVRAGRAAERVYAFGQAVDLYDRALRVLKRGAAAPSQRNCELLLLKEAALERLGKRAAQIEAIGEALAVAEALDDAAITSAILLRRAGVLAYLGRSEQAHDDAERARQIFHTLGDQPGEAEALRELGFVHWHAQDYAAALLQARLALQLHRRMGDITGEASALHNLAEIHRSLGSTQQASAAFEEAMRLHWASGNRSGEILSLFGWAHTLRQAGDLPGALQKYNDALQLSERSGERTMQARALHALAMHHALQGDHESALALMAKVIEVDRSIGYAHALGHDLIDLSDLYHHRGELVESRAALQEALVWFGFTEDSDAMASCRSRLLSVDEDPPPGPMAFRRWVKSHLALGEGKAYCEFEAGRSRTPSEHGGLQA